MDVLIIYLAIAIALFVSAYITKRRFGLLGLALSAGSILSDIWGLKVEPFISPYINLAAPLASAVVLSAIVLAPAIVLLFHGYTYKTKHGRIGGAVLFTLLALAFLVEPLGRVLILSGFGAEVYYWLINNQMMIIGIGLIVAVVDLFFTKPAGLVKSKKR